MMMEQTLRELDFDVVGPFGTVSDALAAIEHEPVDAGILDINLGGEMAYPIARHLAGAKGSVRIHDRIWRRDDRSSLSRSVRIFQKPLEREILREFFVTNAPDLAAAKMPAFAQRSGYAGSRG